MANFLTQAGARKLRHRGISVSPVGNAGALLPYAVFAVSFLFASAFIFGLVP
ncbi:hypothetical protein [Mesorhizobium sp. 1M-11]|uniref:hypothetical protein n=1 Tax=Mesorhizobium sp. 1M-11 TaxID=1529006 RepID=UPI000A5BD6E7|nr:hypothetical protein [Mesorhizobium sp. 1M-11]